MFTDAYIATDYELMPLISVSRDNTTSLDFAPSISNTLIISTIDIDAHYSCTARGRWSPQRREYFTAADRSALHAHQPLFIISPINITENTSLHIDVILTKMHLMLTAIYIIY
jgi:hypothetical protein